MAEESRRQICMGFFGRWHWLNYGECMPTKKKKKGLINVDLIAGTNDSADNTYASCVMD